MTTTELTHAALLIEEARALLRQILDTQSLGPNQGLAVARALSELSNASLDDEV